jgi:hypothetical protein
MSWGWSSLRGRLLSRVGIGVLTWVIPPDLVDEAVGDGLAWEMRLRALPARLGVYFVLGLCLFSQLPYGQVLRELTSGLEAVLATAGWQAPATTALTAVRRRIGEKPLESLFRRLCSALSPGRSPWSHICGLLAVAWDGTTMAAEASTENTAAFGKPGVPERRQPPRNAARAGMTARRRIPPPRARSCGWSRWWRAAPGRCWARPPGRCAARAPASGTWPASCWAACGRACC